MRILALTQKYSGCGYHRLMLPVSLMEKDYAKITDEIPEDIDTYDVVYINRMWHKDNLFDLRLKHGFKLVVDVDDYWVLDWHHLDYDNYTENKISSLIVNHLREADLVTCTHERLAERVMPYNKNILIVPNAIPEGAYQFNTNRYESDKVRLFWCGGISHEVDMKIIKQPLKKIANSGLKDKIRMHVGGYSDGNETERRIWNSIVDSFTANGELENAIQRGLPTVDYYMMYSHADIKLIPLAKTNFNQYKSNLKILEAANKGIPVICSSVHPYLGFPEDLVNYANNDQTWIRWIDKLVSNPILRDEQGAALQEYCRKHYNFFEINKKRSEAFKELICKQLN